MQKASNAIIHNCFFIRDSFSKMWKGIPLHLYRRHFLKSYHDFCSIFEKRRGLLCKRFCELSQISDLVWVRLAERESNQVGFDVQISPIPASFLLDILPYPAANFR